MNACMCKSAPQGTERKEGGSWDVIVTRESLFSRSEGLDDGDGEVGEPSVLGFR